MEKIIADLISSSPEETFDTGEKIGRYIEDNYTEIEQRSVVFVALYGDLGVGKTKFVAGMANALCKGSEVCSPTYSIVNEYYGKHKLVHYDMYRITNEDDLESTGFYDYKNCVIAAEWCENTPFAVPDRRIEVNIERTGKEDERRINVRYVFAEK